MQNDELIDAQTARPLLGFRTLKALYQACSRQEVPHIRLSERRIRFSRYELQRFIAGAAERNGRVTVEEALERGAAK